MFKRHVPKRYYVRSEEHTSELQSRLHLVCRLLLEKKQMVHRPRPAPPRAALARAAPRVGGRRRAAGERHALGVRAHRRGQRLRLLHLRTGVKWRSRRRFSLSVQGGPSLEIKTKALTRNRRI